MEATNLGAYMAGQMDDALDEALAGLGRAPHYRDATWLSEAFRVRARFPVDDEARARSLGVPTWFYGHEPPNPFATRIAKYFENSVREEGLLAMASHGVVFAPGNAGTVQEIFQDACQNYYRTYTAFASPMVLLGTAYWRDGTVAGSKPVWPLLLTLAREKGFEERLLCTDSPDEVRERIRSFAP
jgi:predicted Rossmann-fold nucleotide-binding protein